MKVTCDYCSNQYEDTVKNCPSCGAPNNFVRVANGEPQTIEELKKWYVDHKLPPENVTRYFIGKDIKEPKAFGIYFDGTDYIVYKNKLDGTRAIRYQGGDEKYAVNELYQRLKVDIVNQKSNQRFQSAAPQPNRNASNNNYGGYVPPQRNRKPDNNNTWKIILVILVIVLAVNILRGMFGAIAYDTYHGSGYSSGYSQSYDYDSSYSDNSSSSSWDWGSNDDSDWGSDWDSDSSWDWGDSWDSGSSDWGSDW